MYMPDRPDPPALLLTEALQQAFRSTQYRFGIPGGELLLAIDSPSQQLQRLLAACGRNCAAAITAYNPGGRARDEDSNRRAQQQLGVELNALGLPCFPGRHDDPGGQWPAEISTLVLVLSCAAACAIAARYGQLAIIWCAADGVPRLIETGSQQAVGR
jgi:hypothetical protein